MGLCHNRITIAHKTHRDSLICVRTLAETIGLSRNSIFRNENIWCNLKSSIPADQLLVGKPYGDVGFICRKSLNCNTKEKPQDDNRISVMQIVNNGQIRLTIVGTYLPFFCCISSEKYDETLDKIHAIIDNVDSPVILLGVMNVPLPQQQVLCVSYNYEFRA